MSRKRMSRKRMSRKRMMVQYTISDFIASANLATVTELHFFLCSSSALHTIPSPQHSSSNSNNSKWYIMRL